MKKAFLGLFALGMIVADVSAANAVVCARGVYRAGCAGPRGAVVAPRGPVVVAPRPVVVAPRPVVVAPRCHYRGGVRVCR
jgi:hypothetical protein